MSGDGAGAGRVTCQREQRDERATAGVVSVRAPTDVETGFLKVAQLAAAVAEAPYASITKLDGGVERLLAWFGPTDPRVDERTIEQTKEKEKPGIEPTDATVQATVEVSLRGPDGSRCGWLRVMDLHDRRFGSEIRRQLDLIAAIAEERLVRKEDRDGLTGLATRDHFMEWLQRALDRARRMDHFDFAVLFLDVDRLKSINDTLGHLTGDALLRAVASRLEQSIRPGDSLARLGGDEFAVLLFDVSDASNAARVARRIQLALRTPFEVEGRALQATASVGIALSSTGYRRPEEMLHDADIALYRAKLLGRERFEIFDDAMRAEAAATRRTETELRAAINRSEFELRLLPIRSGRTGRIAGLEAMPFWRHPSQGLLGPDAFLPIAEETGLSLELGEWALRRSCAIAADWSAARSAPDEGVFLALTLSAKHYMAPNLVEEVADALETAGAPADVLRVGIPAAVLSGRVAHNRKRLKQLAALGVRLAVVGYGGSPIPVREMRRLPLYAVHADLGALIGDDSEEDSLVLHALLRLASQLGLERVLTGAGVDADDALAGQLRCEFVQDRSNAAALDVEHASRIVERETRTEKWTID